MENRDSCSCKRGGLMFVRQARHYRSFPEESERQSQAKHNKSQLSQKINNRCSSHKAKYHSRDQQQIFNPTIKRSEEKILTLIMRIVHWTNSLVFTELFVASVRIRFVEFSIRMFVLAFDSSDDGIISLSNEMSSKTSLNMFVSNPTLTGKGRSHF